jgi:hypothetical protein
MCQGPDGEGIRETVAKGGAVVLVRAGYRPLGVAQTTRDVAEEMGAIDMGDLVEEVYLKDAPERFSNSLLLDHPSLLTRNRVPGSTTYHMANWPIPLISRRKPSHETTIMRTPTWPTNRSAILISRMQADTDDPFDSSRPATGMCCGFPQSDRPAAQPFGDSSLPACMVAHGGLPARRMIVRSASP